MVPHLLLNDVQARVLGALIEKEITTPDYYPLSMNAVINACNQKNNREPVMSLDEDAVREALYGLRDQGLAAPASGADSRVTKYEHRLQEVLNLNRRETAILCVLLLRGPQTPGELRGRTERLFAFEELADVQSTLQRLIEQDPPLVRMLPRQPGTKESRYAHLLSGDVPTSTATVVANEPTSTNDENGRIARLESEFAALQNEVDQLRTEVKELRAQIETRPVS